MIEKLNGKLLTLDELNERFYLAIYYNNLKLIKYFDSNIFCF